MLGIFHSADLDGHCSAAILKLRYPEIRLIPMDHGQPFNFDIITPKETIFMVDFCLPTIYDMGRLASYDFIWIDHHKTAIEKMDGIKIPGIRDILYAGCELTWMYCYPHFQIPEGVKLLGRYDVWDHSNPDTLPFTMGFKTYHTDIMTLTGEMNFTKLFFGSLDIDSVVDIGKQEIIKAKLSNANECKRYAFETNLGPYKAIAINKLGTNSQLFDSVWDESKYDIMLSFGYRDGGWVISLYTTKPGIDVSEIAKGYGGGGHVGAAGFPCKSLDIIGL